MPRFHSTLLFISLLAPWAPADAYAQAVDDPRPLARLHFGPLAVTPRITVRDIGVDTNVFNAETGEERDFTMTIMPTADAWLRIGRLHLSSTTGLEWNYYQSASEQRAFNLNERLRLDIDLVRVAPYVTGVYERTRRRPSLEIDERVQQLTKGGGGGIVLNVGPRLDLDLAAQVEDLSYDEGEYGDERLAIALNRESRELRVTPRWTLSVLSAFAVRTKMTRDRFEFSPVRDSDSFSIMPGFEFKPLALISGDAFVGVRRFNARQAAVPDFTGVVAAVDVLYVMRDMTRFGIKVGRDVEYSYEPTEPYYIQSGVNLEVTQALGGSWDAVGRAGGGRLAYQSLAGLTGAGGDDRVDRVAEFGGGFGRRLGEQIRIGLNIDHVSRTSVVAGRSYNGLRVGGAFTYGY
ncbi:MAG TPA: outer membrane beta-barrel protein [Vicinamibacterales bacterium]|nr:outer membrane beta-barrel protein [Vicinamibacterales bacterium]